MFKILKNNAKKLDEIVITEVIDSVHIDMFLKEKGEHRDFPLCPTNAIDIEKKSINNNCISCGLCWLMAPNAFSADLASKDNFLEYCIKNKMFVYTWLSILTKNYSATNVRSMGFSRTKRIPLIIKDKNNVYLIKAIRSSKNVEYALAELDDVIDLNKTILSSFSIHKVIIIVEINEKDLDYLKKFENRSLILSLETLYQTFLISGNRMFTHYLEKGAI